MHSLRSPPYVIPLPMSQTTELPLCIFYPVLRINTPLFQRPRYSQRFFLGGIYTSNELRRLLPNGLFYSIFAKKHPTSLKIYWKANCAPTAISLTFRARKYGSLCEMYGIFSKSTEKPPPYTIERGASNRFDTPLSVWFAQLS